MRCLYFLKDSRHRTIAIIKQMRTHEYYKVPPQKNSFSSNDVTDEHVLLLNDFVFTIK